MDTADFVYGIGRINPVYRHAVPTELRLPYDDIERLFVVFRNPIPSKACNHTRKAICAFFKFDIGHHSIEIIVQEKLVVVKMLQLHWKLRTLIAEYAVYKLHILITHFYTELRFE